MARAAAQSSLVQTHLQQWLTTEQFARALAQGSLPGRSPMQHGTNASRVSDEAGGSAEPTWLNLEDFTIKPAQQKEFN